MIWQRLLGLVFWCALAALHGCVAGGSGNAARGAPVPGASSTATSAAGAQVSAAAPDAPIVRSVPPASAPARDDVCARDRYDAAQKPLTIYTLFDESLSMALWWQPVTEAFSAFVRDPGSAGIHIGLKFFGDQCQPEAYSVPDVPIGPLPANAEPIASQLASRVPLAQTPTAQAIQGATLALQKYAAEHPQEKVVILLVTDASSGIGEGDPEDCYSTVAQAAQEAARAHAATPSIETYVLGLGDASGLGMLSHAGGTGEALIADPSASAAVVSAMQEIRRRALPCSYELPAGAERDPGLVNLERVDASGQAVTIPGVRDAAACAAAQGGWYYDDPRAPRQIIACPVTCAAIRAAVEVSVLLGCPTLAPQ